MRNGVPSWPTRYRPFFETRNGYLGDVRGLRDAEVATVVCGEGASRDLSGGVPERSLKLAKVQHKQAQINRPFSLMKTFRPSCFYGDASEYSNWTGFASIPVGKFRTGHQPAGRSSR